ncbi:MAG: hypothetical protein ACOCS7_00605 [Halolamina sp.]
MVATRTARLLAATLVVLAVGTGVAFAVVDASVLQGETATDSTTGTSQVSNATATLQGPVTLAVEGDGWLEQAVGNRVEAELIDRGATVTRVDTPTDSGGAPVLAIGVAEKRVGYTPFTPSATVETRFAYVTSGNGTLATSIVRGDPMVVHSNRDVYVVGGTVSVQDRARGVSTWPAYQRRVATATGDAVIRALSDAPGMDRPN